MTGRPGIRLLAQSGWDLAQAMLALRFSSFERVVARLEADTNERNVPAEDARLLERALKAWDRRLPVRTACFEQGLAAMRWLRKRGYRATLHYGARGEGESLEAHVWVTSGDVPVVGCDNASRFRELAQYP